MRKRILFIGTEQQWRGGENQIWYLANGLDSARFEPHIAYPEGSLGLKKFSESFPALALTSKSAYDWKNLAVLSEYVQKQDIHIIDANSSSAHQLGVSLKKSLPEIKLVVHRRVDDPPKVKALNFFGKVLWKDKYLSDQVDAFVAISNLIGERLAEAGIASEKIRVVKSAVDTAAFDRLLKTTNRKWLLDKLKIEDSENLTLVGNASALTKQKGYDTFLKSFDQITKTHRDVIAIIAGTGPLEQELKLNARRLGIENQLFFLGHIESVREFLSALDIFLFPSSNEGLGTVMLDAQLAKCCVVASHVGGIPEAITSGENGLLCPPQGIAEFVKALKKVIEDKPFRERLATAGCQRIKEDFNLEKMIEGNQNVYNEILGQ